MQEFQLLCVVSSYKINFSYNNIYGTLHVQLAKKIYSNRQESETMQYVQGICTNWSNTSKKHQQRYYQYCFLQVHTYNILLLVGMAKKILLLRRQRPSKMWEVYRRMFISPYKPSGGHPRYTSDCTVLVSLNKWPKLQHRRNLLKEFNLKVTKGQ